MKKIEILTNENDILEEIKEENKNFSLEEFFLTDGDGAVEIITPKQKISAYSIDEHGTVVEKIYQQIYPDFERFEIFEQVNDKYETWQEQNLKIGNVVIQFCSRGASIVWIPKKINYFQYTELLNLNNEINSINQIFNNEKEFLTNLTDFSSNNLDNVLALIKSRVDIEYSKNNNERTLEEINKYTK